jgi:hypothetical protein
MSAYKIKQIITILILVGLLTACGHPIPAASNELLQQKKSILILTSPTLDKSLEVQMMQTLDSWKQTKLIAYEWIKQVNVVDDLLVKKINNKTYSYIIILGNDLTSTTLASASETKDSRWIVLSESTIPETAPTGLPDNVAWYQLNKNTLSNVVASTPPPTDNSVNTTTYQFTSTPTPTPTPIVKTITVVLLWDKIWAEQLKVIQLNSFEPGIHYYNNQQIRANH